MPVGLIGAVVVLYNPKQEYLSNIDSYKDQVDELLVFDNSKIQSDWLIDFIEANDKIKYKSFHKNKGVAYALNYAAKLFIEKGFKYLLTMDQDSKASAGMVNKLLDEYNDYEKIGIVSPLHQNKIEKEKEQLIDNVSDELVVMTSGNLLNLRAYKEVGRFKEEFFIDYVDTEYCMRLNLNDYKVKRVNSALIFHNEANMVHKNIGFRSVYPYNHSPRRMYFKIRNRLYLREIYKKKFPDYFKYEYPLFRNMLLKIVLFENKKISKIKYAIKGYLDFKKRIMFSPFED